MNNLPSLVVTFMALFLSIICVNSQSTAEFLPVSPFIDTTIQDMIDAAEEGDTVLVASGTYIGEGNRDISFNGKDIVLLSEQGPEHTVIDCEDLGRGFYLSSGESMYAVISGFTIRNSEFVEKGGCLYIRNSSPIVENCFILNGVCVSGGAGIYLESSSSIIVNCFISKCDCAFSGGGVFSYQGSNTFTNCLIQDNESGLHGAGMLFSNSTAIISDCTISENKVEWDGDAQGGGIYSYKSDIIVERCEISNNTCEGGWIAWVHGGGIYSKGGTSIISDCLISGNSAEAGGGVYVVDANFAIFENCDILKNMAVRISGGGMCISYTDLNITGCLFESNYAATGGGGLQTGYVRQAEIEKCTFVNNRTGGNGGGIWNSGGNPEFEHLIIRGNNPDQITGISDITWSNIEDGWPGEGNIDEDPLFVASEYGDYRLLWGSPCIDSGNPDSLDLDGTRSDMGVHPFDQSKELIIYLSPETGEIEPGETGSVKYTVCNAHPVEKNFGSAAGVRRPDGAPWPGNPLEDPFYTSIAPSSNLTREFEYRVPYGWLPGTYSLAAGVGYRGRIFDLDHFEFTVEE